MATDPEHAAGHHKQGKGVAEAAAAPMSRRSWYCHRSPTDNILVASGKWLDKAVPHMPNRYQGLLASSLQGEALSFLFVLDDHTYQHGWLLCTSSLGKSVSCTLDDSSMIYRGL